MVSGPAPHAKSARRPSVAAGFLAEHEKSCPRCREVRRRNLPLFWLCPAARLLVECALKARGRRAA